MIRKKNMDLHLVNDRSLDKLQGDIRRKKLKRSYNWVIYILLIVMIACGTVLLLKNQTYTKLLKVTTYEANNSDTNRYAQFEKGLVRYNRDGIVYLNRKNKERWIQPCQMKNPDIKVVGKTFAVSDIGGNSIMVFNKQGLRGEMKTTRPIEKFAISSQGIVATILNNGEEPVITLYDVTGNILVEYTVPVGIMGYPVALELSDNGKILGVSYLFTKGGVLESKVVFYNFGEKGKEATDYQVMQDTYKDKIIPEIYALDQESFVVVSDDSFILYEGSETPKKRKEVQFGQEIRSSFHTEKYIGFVLLNQDRSGYEVRLYGKNGKQLMSKEFSGEYTDVKMIRDDIIMNSGKNACIITKNGTIKFQGDFTTDVLEIIPTFGLNRYLVVSAEELSVVYLIK